MGELVAMPSSLSFSSFPIGILVALGVLLVLEVALDVIALVDLYRRPIERVALGNKWVWVVLIILVNLVGSILYLAIGRKPAPLVDESAPNSTQAQTKANIADALYGRRDDSNKP
jgi:hypothetical protein